MIKIEDIDFSIEKICISGQCFRMHQIDENQYTIIANHRALTAYQKGSVVELECSQTEFDNIWKEYFDLNEDYTRFAASVDEDDKYLISAIDSGRGIRILKQDLWEMIISFIISQQNNIKRIKKCIDVIAKNYGSKLEASYDKTLYDFPTPEELSMVTENEFRELGLGYRSRYIVETTKTIIESDFLEKIKEKNYNEAKEMLLSLTGVGVKVAECVCLFGLHHLQAFPVDTHIIQVIKNEYDNGFPFHKYLGFEGVMQQYIFYKDLHKK
ncbi:MAG: DNA glycosylase [Suipraeoptans sp.]